MAKQTVDIGSVANDGTGDALRNAFNKINQNNDEVFSLLGNGVNIQMTFFSNRSDAESSGTGNADVLMIGDLVYFKDGSGTALTTGDSNTWSPLGTITPEHWAENTTPGTTDMTSAWNSALAYAASFVTEDSVAGAMGVMVSGKNKKHAISSQIGLNDQDGIHIRDAHFVVTGSWTPTDALFGLLNCDNFSMTNVYIDCNTLSSGIEIGNSNQNTYVDVDIQYMASGGFGFKTSVKATELRLTRCQVKQFAFGDLGWDDQNNRDADGFVMETPDFVMNDCIAAYCRYPFYSTTGGTAQIIASHFYNGGLTTVTGQVYCMYLDDPSNFNIVGNYFDNGAVYINADNIDNAGDGLNLNDNYFYYASANGSNTTYIEIETTVGNNNIAGLNIVGNLFKEELSNLVEFVETGGGGFPPRKQWTWASNQVTDGSMGSNTAVPYLQFQDRMGIDHNGDFLMGTPLGTGAGGTDASQIGTIKGARLMAAAEGGFSGAEATLSFGTNQVVYYAINDNGQLLIGIGDVPGGGNAGQIFWDSATGDLRIVPSDGAGGYDDEKTLRYDVSKGAWRIGNGFSSESLIFQSPDGTDYALSVDNAGNLVTTAV